MASGPAHFFSSNCAVYLGTFIIGLCWTSALTLITPVTENDPSAFFFMPLHSSLDMASSQVSVSTVVCAKTAGMEPIAKAARNETAVRWVRGAMTGPPCPTACTSPSTRDDFNGCGFRVNFWVRATGRRDTLREHRPAARAKRGRFGVHLGGVRLLGRGKAPPADCLNFVTETL